MGAQRSLSRRRLLVDGCASLLIAQPIGCGPRERGAVLRALACEVLSELSRDMVISSRVLHAAVRELDETPSPVALQRARACFRSAALAWKRASTFRHGPFVASQAFPRAAFWPARPAAVEAVLTAAEPIDEVRVESLSVDARGLFALEYLLFAPAAAALLRRERGGPRARSYALQLSANVLGFAKRLDRLVGDGGALGRTLARDGARSVEHLVAQTRDTLEMVRGKLLRVERAVSESLPLETAIEGFFSGSSVAIAEALVRGNQQLYLGGGGGGLCDLVHATSPAIDEHVRAAYAELLRRFSALPATLDSALTDHAAAFHDLRVALDALAHVVAVELVSALER